MHLPCPWATSVQVKTSDVNLKLRIERIFTRAKVKKAEEDDGQLEGMCCLAPSAKGKISKVAPNGCHAHLSCQCEGHRSRRQAQHEASAATAFEQRRHKAPHRVAAVDAD